MSTSSEPRQDTTRHAEHAADHAAVHRLVGAMRRARIAGDSKRADALAVVVTERIDAHLEQLRQASR